MKKIIALPLLFTSMIVSAQNNTDTTLKPAITAIGKPDGEKTEMKIGKEGGSFTSSDGKIRLVVPEDAVSKKTTFSIQPTNNLMPNGNGKAYQMEPSRVNFQKPLQIIFYYAGSEVENNSTDLTGIAMQDDKGQWSSVKKITIDTTSKTISAGIWHFSSYVNFSKAKIDPLSARVKVNGSLRLNIIGIFEYNETGIAAAGSDDDLLGPLGVKLLSSPIWSANGVVNGNSSTGIISASQNYSAIYQAPSKIPEQNPVAVTADLKVDNVTIGTKSFANLKLVSNITVYDEAYEVKMIATLKGGSPAAWGGIVTYKDEGSFIVSLEKDKPAVINIKNHLEVVTDNCLKHILNPTTCTGILHVAGTRQIKVTPANPPGQPYPIVEISFIQYPTELTRFTFLCPPPPGTIGSSKGKVDLTTGAPPPLLMFFGMPALPTYIKFIANDEEQIILEKRSPGSEIYYKFWVRKIKD